MHSFVHREKALILQTSSVFDRKLQLAQMKFFLMQKYDFGLHKNFLW